MDQELEAIALRVPLEQSLAELTAVIVRVKDGLDHEVAVCIARPLVITSDAECESLAEAVRDARNVMEHIKDRHAAVKKFADQLHKVICSQEKALLEQVVLWTSGDRAQPGANQAIAAWIEKQRVKRQQEQAEAQRLLDAQHQKETEKTAKKLERQGEPALAEQVRQQAPYQRPVAYVPPVSVPRGTTVKPKYDFEITDVEAVPRQYCKPDETKIRRQVNLLGKDAVNSIAGVRVFPLNPAAQVRR